MASLTATTEAYKKPCWLLEQPAGQVIRNLQETDCKAQKPLGLSDQIETVPDLSSKRYIIAVMPSTHYIQDGSILCSHGKESSTKSDSILDVTCGHCWRRYDSQENRHPNVREMEHSADLMEMELKRTIDRYESKGDTQMITDCAFWFLRGPDGLPEDLSRDKTDIPGQEALRGSAKKKFMTTPVEFLPGGVGIWSEKYREHVDQLLHAMRPALVDSEETPDSVRKTLREKILDRSGDECPMCGANLSGSGPDSPTIDHIIPSVIGGPSEGWNLRVLCNSCNSFKHVMIDPAGAKKAASGLEERIEEEGTPVVG